MLPREVREKILSTFRHTLNLYKEGKTDDCLIGCDFILKMDPRFAPARQLMEKAKNPAAGVDVAALEADRLGHADAARSAWPRSRPTGCSSARPRAYNARDFDAAIAAAEQVLQVLPGQSGRQADPREGAPAARTPRRSSRSPASGPSGPSTRNARPRRARRSSKMRSIDADHPAVALLERKLAAPAPAEIGESTNPGLIAPRGPAAAGATPARAGWRP